MRISALSKATGVPIATIKYYVREGLVPAGRVTARTQAEYDESHVARLRLARALVQVGGLSVTSARGVMALLDAADGSMHDVLGAAHYALPPQPRSDVEPVRARQVVEELGWQVTPRAPALGQLEHALGALDEVGAPADEVRLRLYAEAAHRLAELDVSGLPQGPPDEAAAAVVIGTVLWEPILLALRRLAQEAVSAERNSTPATRHGPKARGAS